MEEILYDGLVAVVYAVMESRCLSRSALKRPINGHSPPGAPGGPVPDGPLQTLAN